MMGKVNKYKASIIDMDVKTENRGATARMSFTINVMSGVADGTIDRAALMRKISDVTDRISDTIKRSNTNDFEKTIMGIEGKEYYYQSDGKLVPKD